MLPLSSEATLTTLVGTQGQFVAPVFVATAANVFGVCTIYWLGEVARALARRRKPTTGGRTGDTAAPTLRGPAPLLSPFR